MVMRSCVLVVALVIGACTNAVGSTDAEAEAEVDASVEDVRFNEACQVAPGERGPERYRADVDCVAPIDKLEFGDAGTR